MRLIQAAISGVIRVSERLLLRIAWLLRRWLLSVARITARLSPDAAGLLTQILHGACHCGLMIISNCWPCTIICTRKRVYRDVADTS